MFRVRMSCAAILAALGVACQGCIETSREGAPVRASVGTSREGAPVQASVRTEDPPPGTETRAPARPVAEFTPAATAKVEAIMASAGFNESRLLRLEASWPKGVCGPQHKMEFEEAPPSSQDHAFKSGGINVVVHKRQVEMLRGTVIDYGEKDGQQGFIINTPNFQGELLEKWGPVLQSDPLSAAR